METPEKEAAEAPWLAGRGRSCARSPLRAPSGSAGPRPLPLSGTPLLPAQLGHELSVPAAAASPEDPAASPWASQRPGPWIPPQHPASPSPRKRRAGPLRQREDGSRPPPLPSQPRARLPIPPPGNAPRAQTSAAEQGLHSRVARPGARRQQPGLQVLQQRLAGEEAVGHGGGDDTCGPPLHPATAIEAWEGATKR